MKQSTFIDQIMVVGDGQKFPAALIQLNFDTIEAWASKQGVSLAKNETWSDNKKVYAKILDEVNQINERFGQWEKIKEIRITPDVWSIEEGHLTPTMKLKRKSVKAKYQTLYNSIYNL